MFYFAVLFCCYISVNVVYVCCNVVYVHVDLAIYLTMVVSNQKALATLVIAHIWILFVNGLIFLNILLFLLLYYMKCVEVPFIV